MGRRVHPPKEEEGSHSTSSEYCSSLEDGRSSSSSPPPSPLSPTLGEGSLTLSFNSSFSSLSSPGLHRTKIFKDMIHPHLELPQLCNSIINTPQFQRLRNLKQLGMCYYVYPSASHNRFEHCIGVSYLAGKYCKILQKNQPELGIDSRDILCLYVGGLCHDLGHGPFSHTWEHFMKNHFPDYSHEEMSIKMLDYLLEDNDLWKAFEGEGLTQGDLIFIKEIILGHPLKGRKVLEGRKPNKYFLYQIVANEQTKIDVDKFDYILRDCKQLHVNTSFDYERVLDNSRVFFIGEVKEPEVTSISISKTLDEHSVTAIAYRKKISATLEDLFIGRFSLHQKAYQHKVTRIIEEMLLDALEEAEPHFLIEGLNGQQFSLSQAHQDITAFMKLTDFVFEQIFHLGNGGPKAKRLLHDILTRTLYKSMGYIQSPFNEKLLQDLQLLSPSVVLIRTNINYGKGDENPLGSVLFYEKLSPDVLTTKKFPTIRVESKCFIVLRPLYSCKDMQTTEEEEQKHLKGTEEKVNELFNLHKVRLLSE